MANKSFLQNTLYHTNPKRFVDFIKELKDEFGTKFMLMLTSGYLGGRGTVQLFLQLNETPFYRQAGYPVSVNQTARAISELPMALKGLAGLHTDYFPILGFKISAWMFIYSVIGSVSIFLLAIIPFNAEFHPFYLPAILFCLAMLQVFFMDVMLQGKYAEIMNKRSSSRGNIIAFSYLIISIGGFFPGVTVGVLADVFTSPRYTFYIVFPLALQPLIFIACGCIPNDRASRERNNRFDIKKFKLQLPVNTLNIIVILSSFGFLIASLFFSTDVAFWYSVISSVVVVCIQFFCFPLAVALISTYMYFGQALYLQIQPTLEYYLLGDEICVPGGPHFSYTYLKTIIGIVSQIGKLIGVWLYQAVLTRGSYRQIYWISIVLRMGAAMFDLVIVKRWNLLIGIPDQYFYLFGHAVIYEITYMLDYLPYGLIIAKISPKSVEVTLFGVLAGIGNYGRTIAILAGGYVAQLLNIETGLEGGTCNFENMHWVILISNLFIPFLLVPMAFLLIPNKKVGMSIVDETWENSRYLFKSFTNKKIVENSEIKA